MAKRTTKGQSIVGGFDGVTGVVRFRSAITPNGRPTFGAERPFGSKNDTDHELLSEHTEAGIDSGGTVNLAELIYFLSACLGRPRKTALAGGLFRYEFVNKSFEEDDIEVLEIARGNSRVAERFAGAVISALSVSVSKGGGTNSVTGTMLAGPLQVGADLGVAARQTLAVTGGPTGGTFTLGTSAGTTAPIAYNATAADIATALNAVLGAGYVTATGGPINTTAVTVTFVGASGAVAALTATDVFTGGDPAAGVLVTVVRTGDPVALLPDAKVSPGRLAVYLGTARPTAADPDVNAGTGFVSTGFTWSVSDRFQPFHAQDGTGAGPNDFNPGESTSTTSSWVMADETGMTLVESYRNSTQVYHSAVGYRPDGQGLQIHSRAKVSATEDFGDDQGAYGLSYTFGAIHDDVYGGSQIVVIDSLHDVTFPA